MLLEVIAYLSAVLAAVAFAACVVLAVALDRQVKAAQPQYRRYVG